MLNNHENNEISLQDYLEQLEKSQQISQSQQEDMNENTQIRTQNEYFENYLPNIGQSQNIVQSQNINQSQNVIQSQNMFLSFNGSCFDNLVQKYEKQKENIIEMQKQQQQGNQMILQLQNELEFYYKYSNKHPNKENNNHYQSNQNDVLINKYQIEKQQLISNHEKQIQQYKMKVRELLSQLKNQQKYNLNHNEVLNVQNQNYQIKNNDQNQKYKMNRLQKQFRDLKEQQKKTEMDFSDWRQNECTKLKKMMELFIKKTYKSIERNNKNVQEQLQKLLQQKRILYNQLQELKGNIRVICRVRPLMKNESQSILKCSENRVNMLQRNQNFEFDNVKDHSVDQFYFFQEIEPLIESLMDGYNVTLFAYGPTGSGKTYTMEGPEHNKGVFTRSIRSLFQNMKKRDYNYEFDIKISMLEIYNEQIKDLLADKQKKLEIKLGQNGTYVQDLRIVEVQTIEQIEYLMNCGTKNRATGTTNLNEHSSRSHMIYSVYVQIHNKYDKKQSFRTKLHLIDLAGSEKLSKSGATGDLQKETIFINKSLTSLGDVIGARINKQSHIPYRNSTLTYFLQDSLSGDSKTLMILNLSPAIEMMEETLSSLKFGQRVRKVESGRIKRNSSLSNN